MLQQHWLHMLNLSCFKERYEGFESLQEVANSTQTIIMQEVIIANTEGNKKGALKSKSWTMPAKMVNFYSVQTRKVNTAASLEEREIFTVQHFLNSGSLHQFWLKILESINSLALNLQDTVTIVKNHCSVRTPALHNTDIRHWIPRQSVKVLGRKPNSMGFFFFSLNTMSKHPYYSLLVLWKIYSLHYCSVSLAFTDTTTNEELLLQKSITTAF